MAIIAVLGRSVEYIKNKKYVVDEWKAINLKRSRTWKRKNVTILQLVDWYNLL